MADSVKELINNALIARLQTITAVNGYDTDIAKVYGDKIPMGLELEDFNMPAILCISGDDKPEMKHQCYHGTWHFELQLWHGDVDDKVMLRYVRDVYKAIFAGGATAQINNAFRSLHPSVYNVIPMPTLSDLGMIEANRCYMVNIAIQYSTKLWNL